MTNDAVNNNNVILFPLAKRRPLTKSEKMAVAEKFKRALEDRAEIAVSGRIRADGKLHDLHIKGDPRGSRNCQYILSCKDAPCGIFLDKEEIYGGMKIWWDKTHPENRTAEQRKASFLSAIEEFIRSQAAKSKAERVI